MTSFWKLTKEKLKRGTEKPKTWPDKEPPKNCTTSPTLKYIPIST